MSEFIGFIFVKLAFLKTFIDYKIVTKQQAKNRHIYNENT